MFSYRPHREAVLRWLWMVVILGLATRAPLLAADVPELEEIAMRAAVQAVAPSVVRIEIIGGFTTGGGTRSDGGVATGLIVAEDGYVISSAFHFANESTSILVTLPSGQRAAASIVARDHSRMLVLLKVNFDERLPMPQTTPRDEIAVGQWAVAVGRTYAADAPNVSVGIISATNRVWGKAIQTDAKVSPANYGGPLIDLHGRVLGVLVPLSPEGQGPRAGAEWYDSGIGFAIPMAQVVKQLPRLREGKDRHAGILGVSMKSKDVYGAPVVIGICLPNSPASDAGLKAGDQIVEVEGRAIQRQLQLRHALGPLYAGDVARVVVLRDGQRIEVQAELTDTIQPYEHPFLGILPRRGVDPDGDALIVRFVYPGGPADEAGIKADDALVGIDGQPLDNTESWRERLAQYQPGESLAINIRRGQQTIEATVTLGAMPTDVPDDLPPAHPPVDPTAQRPPVGVVDIQLPEEPNQCFAYVPDGYDPSIPHGVVVWLDAPGSLDKQQVIDLWKEHCTQRDLILLAPASVDPKRWQPTEIEVVRKMLDEFLSRYEIDDSRIVVHGYQGGGALAYRVAFAHRQVFRGIAAVDAPLPMPPPPNDPLFRLAVYSCASTKSALNRRIGQGVNRLRGAKYPVTAKAPEGTARYLNAGELTELARWIDTLDRI